VEKKRMGVNGQFVFPKDGELYKKFERLDYKLAWIEECGEYLQMCIRGTDGEYFESQNSKFDKADCYAEEHCTTEDIFLRNIELTGDVKKDKVPMRDLHAQLKADGLQENKKKFKSWMCAYIDTKYKAGNVVYKNVCNVGEVRGIRLKDMCVQMGGEFDQFS
jgi:hypothetical protein